AVESFGAILELTWLAFGRLNMRVFQVERAVRLPRLSPAGRHRHHLAVMSLIYLFAFSVLLCSVHCVLPAQASSLGGHHHHDSDQDHKLCGICAGAIPSPLVPAPRNELLVPIGAFLPHIAVRGRDKWHFWAEPRAPPFHS